MPLQPGMLLLDRYRIEKELARGGFGAVYLARDENMASYCAVKENLAATRAAERQFRREAKLLATVSHPHLPRVTNHFLLEGNQYLVMDYVEGDDLATRLEQESPLQESEVLRWADQIGDALEYLHGLDPPVIHRDIKPANIKINPEKEAMLVDFGIAKEAHAGKETSTGAKGVTPGFAPPEQYDLGQTDARTDVYAFGATIYNLLTGHVPPDSVERLIGAAEFPPLNQLRPDLDENVGLAVARAMQVRADDRFQRISQFRQALADPKYGQEPSTETDDLEAAAEPERKSVRRFGWPAAGAAISLATLALFAVIMLDPLSPGGAFEMLNFVLPQLGSFAALPTMDLSTQEREPPTRTPTPTLIPTPTATPLPVELGSQNAYGWRLFDSWREGVSSVPFSMSGDGSQLALISRQGVDIFDVLTGALEEELQGFVVGRPVFGLEYLDDSILVLFDNEILRYSLETKNLISQLTLSGDEMLVSPDQSRLAVRDKYVSLLDLGTDQLLATLGSEGENHDFAFSPDGAYFALTSGDNVELYGAESGRLERTLRGHGEPTSGLSFTDDSALLIAASGDIWEVASGDLQTVFDSATGYAVVSPNGELIVGEDGSVWIMGTGERLTIIPFEFERVRKMAFANDGQFLVRQDHDGTIELWTADPNAELPAARAGMAAALLPIGAEITPLNVSELADIGRISGAQSRILISPDWTTAATWSPGGATLSIIDLQDSSLIGSIRATGAIRDAAYLGSDYLTLNDARGMRRWDIWTQKLMQEYAFEGQQLMASPGGEILAVQDKYIQVVDPVTGKRIHNLGSADSGQDFRFAPDGAQLAIAAGPAVGLWDMETGRRIRQLSGHGPTTHDLEFTPDGSLLLSASGDLWEVETGRRIAAFNPNASQLAVSPDGALVVGNDGSLWDGQTGQYLGTLDQNAERVWFTPNNRQIIFAGGGGQVSVYGIAERAAGLIASLPPASDANLRPLTAESIRDLGVIGWWGEDPVFEVRLARDRGVNPFGSEQFKDVVLSPGEDSISVLTDLGVRVVRPEDGQILDNYDFFLNPETIREIAYLGETLLLLKAEVGVEQWDLEQARLIARYDVQGEGLVASPDAGRFALRSGARVLVVDAPSGEMTLSLPASEAYAFSPVGSELALSRSPMVELWDLEEARRLRTLPGGGGRLAYSADGGYLISGDGVVWDVEAASRVASFDAGSGTVAIHPRADLFAASDGSLRTVPSGERIATLFDLRAPAEEIFFVGDTLVWVSEDGHVTVWGVDGAPTSEPARVGAIAISPANAGDLSLLSHFGRGRLEQAVWSSDAKYLAINTSQNTLIYIAPDLRLVEAILDAETLAFDSDGNTLIGGPHSLQLINPDSGAVVNDFGHEGITAAAYSPDGTSLVIGGAIMGAPDGLAIIDLADGLMREIEVGRGSYGEVVSLEFTPDGIYLVQSLPGAIQLWDVEHGRLVRQPIRGNTGPATVSPDGRHLAYFTHRFIVEDLVAGGQYRSINADGTPFFATGLDHPSLRLLDYSFGSDGQLNVFYRSLNRRTFDEDVAWIAWDIHDSPASAQIKLPDIIRLSDLSGVFATEYEEQRPQLVPSIEFGGDERYLASLTPDGVVRVWQAASGELLAQSSADSLDLLAFDPDGGMLAVPNALGEIQIIDLDSGGLEQVLEQIGFPEWMAYGSESVLMLLQPSGNLALIDTVSGDPVESFNLDGYSGPEYLTMSPEGQIFANLQLFGGQNRLQLLSLSPFRPLYELDRYPLPAGPLIAPVGDLLAMPRRGEVELWDLHSNTLTGKLESSMSEVGVLAFTPDGSHLIAASGEIWDLGARQVSATFESSDPSMSVITNGSVILGQDGTIWSLADGARLGRLDTQPALEFAFTPDGSQIIWQRAGGIVEVWGIEDG